jgi:hypothetical protein
LHSEIILATGVVPRLLPVIADGTVSIAEIVLKAGFRLEDFGRLTVDIADQIIPLERWHLVRPKPKSEALMRISVRPLGGGDGAVLKTVLSVLLVAAAVALTGGAAAFAVGPLDIGLGGGALLFGAGSFEASLAAAAVLSVGQAGLDALFPSSVKAKNETVIGNAGARTNTLRPGDYLPRVFGTTKIWPPQLTKPIRFFDGRDEIVEVLYGVAGRTVLSDIRIAGAPAADVDGVTVQVVDWTAPLEQQTLLNKYGVTKTVGRPLQWYLLNKEAGIKLLDQSFPEKSAPAWDTVSFPDADEMRIRLVWPQGLAKRNDNTIYVHQAFRMRMRPRGTTTWTNFPEFWFSNDETADYRKDIVIRRDGTTWPATKKVSDTRKTVSQVFSHVPGQGLYTTLADGVTANGSGGTPAGSTMYPKTGEWTAHTAFGNTGGSAQGVRSSNARFTKVDEGIIFSISDAMLARGPCEIQIISGAVVENSEMDFTLYGINNSSTGGRTTADFFGFAADVNTSAYYGTKSIDDMSGEVLINELCAVMNAAPTIGLTNADCALIAVRGRNVQVGDVTTIATSVVYDRVSESWIETDSPAKLSEALARGDSTHRGLSATIDTLAYDAWQAECLAEDYKVSFETAGGRWDDVQKMLASGGRGGFAMARSWRPYFDRDRSAEAAVMAFTPANSRYMGLSRSWGPVRTDALRVTWREASEDYTDRSKIIYAPGITQASYRGLEDVQYPELADEALVTARGYYDLAQSRYRGTRLQFETDHAAEAVEKGDLVLCIWDVLAEVDETHLEANARAASQSAYIRTVTRNLADQITAIELEREVYVEPSATDFFALTDVFVAPNVMAIGDPYVGVVAVGRDDPDDALEQPGYVLSLDLDVATAGATTTIPIVPASVPRADRIAPGQIFSVGRRQRLRRRSIVDSIVPSGEFFRITTVPEAPEIFA